MHYCAVNHTVNHLRECIFFGVCMLILVHWAQITVFS